MTETNPTLLSLTPGLPPYAEARAFLHVMQGVSYKLYRRMYDQIWEQVGSPKETVDWTAPQEWIPQRLDGMERELALKIWQETGGQVNPRYTRGCWYLASKHGLLERDDEDCLHITPAGREFSANLEGERVALIDRGEGLLTLLQIVSERSPGRRSEILPDYVNFCNTYTTYRSLSVHKSSLYDRLVNLVERKLITRSGLLYEITDAGLQRLQKYADLIHGRAVTTRQTELQELAQSISQAARAKLAEHLSLMNPYRFEELISLLLEEMGYTDVKVTSPSNDKGVDVVADIELGISSVREVVQVKRHSGSINRTILDQLRGSLHRFKAMRGTIITSGTFSNGAKTAAMEQGAAPITLIDGKKLLNLLLQYEIGISKKAVEFYEFDESRLLHLEDEQTQAEEQDEVTNITSLSV
jgi:restriction system protein